MIEFIERVQEFPSGEDFRHVIRSEMERANLNALRVIARDVDEMAMTLEPHQRDGLEAILQERPGDAGNQSWETQIAAARQAIARNTIRSERERQRFERFIEAAAGRGDDTKVLVEELRTLLRRS
ncbi:MAG: hypothetical protein KJZ74_14210 [Gemmatimonadales bacterium]|nr:hypothetical protein [Gemmatimonadales bacterium]